MLLLELIKSCINDTNGNLGFVIIEFSPRAIRARSFFEDAV